MLDTRSESREPVHRTNRAAFPSTKSSPSCVGRYSRQGTRPRSSILSFPSLLHSPLSRTHSLSLSHCLTYKSSPFCVDPSEVFRHRSWRLSSPFCTSCPIIVVQLKYARPLAITQAICSGLFTTRKLCDLTWTTHVDAPFFRLPALYASLVC